MGPNVQHLEDYPSDVARALAELQARVDVDDAGGTIDPTLCSLKL